MELSQLGVLEPELKRNLLFAISAMDTLPLMLKKSAGLLVEGSQILISITAGNPSLHCVVFQDHEGIRLHQTIKPNRELRLDDFHKAFFHGHDCPHDTPCWEQAMNIRSVSSRQLELNIVCKELRVTFSDPAPVEAIVVPTSKNIAQI